MYGSVDIRVFFKWYFIMIVRVNCEDMFKFVFICFILFDWFSVKKNIFVLFVEMLLI